MSEPGARCGLFTNHSRNNRIIAQWRSILSYALAVLLKDHVQL